MSNAGKWTKLDIIGMRLLEWTAWGFLLVFVVFLVVAIVGGFTGLIDLRG